MSNYHWSLTETDIVPKKFSNQGHILNWERGCQPYSTDLFKLFITRPNLNFAVHLKPFLEEFQSSRLTSDILQVPLIFPLWKKSQRRYKIRERKKIPLFSHNHAIDVNDVIFIFIGIDIFIIVIIMLIILLKMNFSNKILWWWWWLWCGEKFTSTGTLTLS